MPAVSPSTPRRVAALFLTAGLAVAAVGTSPAASRGNAGAKGARYASALANGQCPQGYRPAAKNLSERQAEQQGSGVEDIQAALDRDLARDRAAVGKTLCVSLKAPEPFAEVAGLQAERAAKAGIVPPGAHREALAQRAKMVAAPAAVRGANGTWTPVGKTPLISDDPAFDDVNLLGLGKLNGRVDALDYDAKARRLYALVGTGGIWLSENFGKSWRSISDSLPTQVVGAMIFTPAGGPDGTIVAGSGEATHGGNNYTGLGAFWSNDLGRTWHQSAGVPDGAMSFQVAVDPTDPTEVYVATSQGLYRSTDTGKTFTNVKLPTGECAGKVGQYGPRTGTKAVGYDKCQYANFVTDVVIRAPGGHTNGKVKAGTVLAAVGYRAGQRPFTGDLATPHSPNNGIYRSETGEPDTFKKLDVSGTTADLPNSFAPQDRIGRTELGAAVGPGQNHDFVYAIVEDAVLFNGGVPAIDVPEGQETAVGIPNGTSFNGIYVSKDFGATWTQMADDREISFNASTGSALISPFTALFAPGVQAWYNEWIKPDPTRQTADGVPTRVVFGLEEVWQNRDTNEAQDGAPQRQNPVVPAPTGGNAQFIGGDFKVIGPYFADDVCLFLDNPLPVCPTSEGFVPTKKTTHPDQQDGIWVPTGDGGVSLIVGNDGGTYVQTVAEGKEFSEEQWSRGENDGYHTLLPYDAEPAKDGTIWYGLQDNGSGKITPAADGERQLMTFGGDGFFVAVDPDNSNVAYSETTFADMRVTVDGGRNWRNIPPPISSAKFSNPFVMDPTDAKHLMTAGRQVVETVFGPDTFQTDPAEATGECFDNCWEKVFDLGTVANPGRAPGITDMSTRFSMSALDLQGDAAYVGFCGVCDILQAPGSAVTGSAVKPFKNGLATNVGGDKAPKRMTSDGWHLAKANGLPNRYITSVAVDPADTRTVYVTLGGYANREWAPPGSYKDPNDNIGKGHVFKSTDAGENFVDVSGNLPDTQATWVELNDGQLVVGTDLGAFLSSDTNGSRWAALSNGLPVVPISTIRTSPADPNLLVVATFGRGVYTYRFPGPARGRTGGGGGTGGGGTGGGGGGSGGGGRGRAGGTLPATGGSAAAVGIAAALVATGVVSARRRRRARV